MRRIAAITAAVGAAALASGTSAAPAAHDGKWWHASGVEERRGFLAGYLDCAVFDGGRTSLRDVSWHLLEPKVTKHYDARLAEQGTPVADVLLALAAKEPARRGVHGEAYAGKHGMFDGEYWRQSDDLHRRGFVAGLVDCWKREEKLAAGYSKPMEWYVTALSEWFRVSDSEPDEIDPRRSTDKIAEVLERLHD